MEESQSTKEMPIARIQIHPTKALQTTMREPLAPAMAVVVEAVVMREPHAYSTAVVVEAVVLHGIPRRAMRWVPLAASCAAAASAFYQ